MMVLVIDVLKKMVNAMRLCRGESQNEQHRKRERETARQPTASTEGVHCRCTRFLPDVAGERKRKRFRLMYSCWRIRQSSDGCGSSGSIASISHAAKRVGINICGDFGKWFEGSPQSWTISLARTGGIVVQRIYSLRAHDHPACHVGMDGAIVIVGSGSIKLTAKTCSRQQEIRTFRTVRVLQPMRCAVVIGPRNAFTGSYRNLCRRERKIGDRDFGANLFGACRGLPGDRGCVARDYSGFTGCRVGNAYI